RLRERAGRHRGAPHRARGAAPLRLPPDRRPRRPPRRHPHPGRRRDRHRPADRADEVRVPHGRLPAAGGRAAGQQGRPRGGRRDDRRPLAGQPHDRARLSMAGLTRRRRFARWRLESHSGADVVSLRQLSAREQLRVTAPSLITTMNMACGFSSVLLDTKEHFTLAAALIAIAVLFDIADGAVARLVGATSPFGIQLDSLADLVSFGLAPAFLIYAWVLPEWPVVAWVAAFLWLACAAFRLARFNFTIDPTDDKRYFIGLPSPAGAAIVMSTVLALDSPEAAGLGVGPSILAPVLISLVPAWLMVSTIRFRSFRDLVSPRTRQARVTTGLVALAVVVGLV